MFRYFSQYIKEEALALNESQGHSLFVWNKCLFVSFKLRLQVLLKLRSYRAFPCGNSRCHQ